VTNVPSITIEEVVPGGVSDATRLAPEEIYDKKKGELVVVSPRFSALLAKIS